MNIELSIQKILGLNPSLVFIYVLFHTQNSIKVKECVLYIWSKVRFPPPIQILQYKKLAHCFKKLTCCRGVNHSGLELQHSSNLIKGWGGSLRIYLTMNN